MAQANFNKSAMNFHPRFGNGGHFFSVKVRTKRSSPSNEIKIFSIAIFQFDFFKDAFLIYFFQMLDIHLLLISKT